MSWRKRMLKWSGPGILGGIAFDNWLKLLRENRFAIDPRYWWRANVITMSSLRNSCGRHRENAVFGEQVRQTSVAPPLFLLGIWRSGTTHLQNLFSIDSRFGFPNWFEASYPHRFLLTRSSAPKLERWLMPRQRLQDNMEFGFELPAEEEFALCSMTSRSPLLSWVFPREASRYDRYLTMRNVPDAEVSEWKSAFLHFVRKLAFQCQRPLVLKSPPQTARIRLLLELFPEAKFVHICRNPHEVYPSIVHTGREVIRYCALQDTPLDLEERALRQYLEIFDAYIEDKGLIQPNRLCEVRFEDLVQDPIEVLRTVYGALSLPDFRDVEPVVQRYVASLSSYRKNAYIELDSESRARLVHCWRRSFDTWGYFV